MDGQTGRQTVRLTDGQSERLTNRQAGRLTDRWVKHYIFLTKDST